tara:strand:- start:150 stop:332 length:183 start_codon:yes stop_codon:yes gene_type:complete
MKRKTSILSQIERIEDQISILSDREYNPDISTSEQKELSRRKKKLNKAKGKLIKRLKMCN